MESQLQNINADNTYNVGTDADTTTAMNNDLNRQPVLFSSSQLDQNAFMQTVEDAYLDALSQKDTDTTLSIKLNKIFETNVDISLRSRHIIKLIGYKINWVLIMKVLWTLLIIRHKKAIKGTISLRK
ncbi:hypothetical protein [Pediococcus cellicola]|uniref:Uncharacterized protein n=1 Tax=Pediococcus cellicola TaxID=319652 RepID=A0A0R2INQ9_9LACO|nr:hypothetical protein [Pediococcus cellicola]KRN66803.1 hypothetical protein IV80_GL001396 [Pediococcus cellicola]GEL16161.1 hypothetical protein PCE01_19630 [Pediococcus cellicola]